MVIKSDSPIFKLIFIITKFKKLLLELFSKPRLTIYRKLKSTAELTGEMKEQYYSGCMTP